MATLLTDDERVAAATGRGVEVATRRMELFEAATDRVRGVNHALAAIEALTLHLLHVEAGAHKFAKAMGLNRADIPDDDNPPMG